MCTDAVVLRNFPVAFLVYFYIFQQCGPPVYFRFFSSTSVLPVRACVWSSTLTVGVGTYCVGIYLGW